MKTFLLIMTMVFGGGAAYSASHEFVYSGVLFAFVSGWHFHMWLMEDGEEEGNESGLS